MAAPNLTDPTAVIGKTIPYAVTTTLAAALSNASNSNRLLRVNAVYCSNVDGVNPADITLEHFNGTSSGRIAFTISVPADATQVLVTREARIDLEEGHSLRAQASANGDLELVISYEEIS